MNLYSYDVRLLMCPNCGGSLEVPPGGGHCQCPYCGMSSAWQQRPMQTFAASIDDSARLAVLFDQTNQPDHDAPESIRYLQVRGGAMPAELSDQAFAEFQRARGELGHTGDASERIFFTTFWLYNTWTAPTQRPQQRSLLETASELVTGPGHRAVLQGMMARNACRGQDLQSATQWVGLMDPNSSQLRADSAYRVTRAYVDTAKHNFDQVIDVLGAEIGAVPLSAGDVAMCIVMRANAHEQLGEIAKATSQLLTAMQSAPHLSQLFGAIIAANPSFAMCGSSYRPVS